MSFSDVTVGPEPHDRLTRLCELMTDALDEALEDGEQIRGIVFLNNPEKGGIQMFGYPDTGSGLADLLVHMKAMFASMGKGFGVMNDQGEMLMPIGPLGEEKP